ncbi:MAG: anaerobic glycerol-3-phosphate dehydrogenase subunit B [Candidatus Thorarchaeota archaeon]|nr:anaerobic glycerol-3-phosphate dehydrogenase subunit B [Candidatus Thorarchaeota archaeon]
MDLDADVLVIGGGMAGLIAGTVTAQSGLSTVLVRKGQSATEYSSGAIDILGYLPESFIPFSSPIEGLQILPDLYPLHPYSLFAHQEEDAQKKAERVVSLVGASVEWLTEALAGSIAPIRGSLDSNLFPLTILGTSKPTCLLQETMWYGNLLQEDDSVLLFAGVSGHPEFRPSIAAKTFLERQVRRNEPPRKIGHCMVDIVPFGNPHNLSSIDIARHLDHSDSIDGLIESLRPHSENLGATHISLPPALGIEHAVENQKRIEESLGVKCFELLALPPSVPGLRLQKALDRLYLESGGKLLLGHEAVDFVAEMGQLSSVRVKGPRRQLSISPKAVILAAGKFIGGGISADQNGFRENIMNLMTVTEEFYSAENAKAARHTNAFSLSPRGQPFLASGLSTDFALRPINKEGEPTFTNLFAAGSVIAGYNYAAEKSGLGVSLVTGRAAGQFAAGMIKGMT